MRAPALPQGPWIVGHRGLREDVPENTVASVLVVFHDLSIGVAEGQSEWVGRMSLEEIKRCRPVWKRQGREREYEVPTLVEVLAAAPPGLPLNLEIKQYDAARDPAAVVEALAGAIEGRDQVLVSSFDGAILVAVRESLADLPLAPLGGRTANWVELVELARRLDAFSIHIDRRLAGALASKGRLDEPEAKERPLLVYTVNRAAEARRLLRSGVAGLFTDHPGALRAELEEAV
jgi:glycerophosphoryl diester phosphodiesterase